MFLNALCKLTIEQQFKLRDFSQYNIIKYNNNINRFKEFKLKTRN